MNAEKQTAKLAHFIIDEVEGEPVKSEGVGDCAIRIIKTLQGDLKQVGTELDSFTSLCHMLQDELYRRWNNDLEVISYHGVSRSKSPTVKAGLCQVCHCISTSLTSHSEGGDTLWWCALCKEEKG